MVIRQTKSWSRSNAFTSVLFFLAALHFLAPGGVWAGINYWSGNGPETGSISALAIDPQNPATIYAASGADIFKSSDGGMRWSSVNSGLADQDIGALVIDPVNPATIYSLTSYQGLLKSSDGGAHWKKITPPLRAIALDPAVHTTIYAVTFNGEILHSRDAGESWNEIPSDFKTIDPYPATDFLAINPAEPATLFAGITGKGLFKSPDGGRHWFDSSSGLTSKNFRALLFDPAVPTTLYLATDGGGVFKSMDGGASWTARNTGITYTSVRTLAIDPQRPSTIYAALAYEQGIYRSLDGGNSWSAVNSGLKDTDIFEIAIDPSTPGTLFAATGSGICKSVDGGEHWTAVVSGLADKNITALALDPSTAGTLFAGTASSGIFKSSDDGMSWSALNSGLGSISDIVINAATPPTIYAATRGGVFTSKDGGSSWNASNSGLTNLDVRKLSLDPSAPQTILAAGAGGAFKSTDGGASWQSAGSGMTDSLITALAVSPWVSETIFAGTMTDQNVLGGGGGKLFRSLDGGGNWSDVYSIPPWTESYFDGYIRSLAASATNPGTLYAGIDGQCQGGGVLKSSDAGASWSPLDLLSSIPDPSDPCANDPACHALIMIWPDPCPLPKVRAIVNDPLRPATLYAGTNRGLWISTDNGARWRDKNLRLENYDIQALVAAPGKQTTLYAGTSGGGVYKLTWVPPDANAAENGGRPSLADALKTLRFTVGLDFPDGLELARYDVAPLVKGVPNPSGSIDIDDALQILRNVVGLVSW